ncbi:MAG: o-succinylbenzoate--CoA ligase [Actinomycetota bacterium]|nr:o-succinylbenzoate--CoA ligase [Actinomycetota bacterium]
MRVPDWLARRADDHGDRPALLCGEIRWTFRELDARAGAVAARLADLGVQPGERVALLLRNGPAFVALAHGISRRGAVLVPLNVRLTALELAWQVAESEARLLVADEENASAARDLDVRRASASELCGNDTPPAISHDLRIDLEAAHSILYTSGTTGRPRGVILTYANHWWSAIGSALNLGADSDDRWLAVLPLFHVGGLSILLRSVIYGNPVVLQSSFDPAAANRAIDEERITIVSLVSEMLQRMLEERDGRPYPSHLRCVLVGGGPAPPKLLEACARQAVPVAPTYGLTEAASQVATLSPAEAVRKPGSAGKALLPTELRIRRRGGTAPPGEPGEILVRGPTVAAEYTDGPVTTTDEGGASWLHTGDIGYLDDEGYLYVLDRRDDLLISGGENVYPAEVEAALLAHESVEDVGVVGVPDPRWGQVPLAVVKLRDGAATAESELIAHCAGLLARYKVPTHVLFAETLPRTAGGKLRRDVIRAQAQARIEASPEV